MLAPTFLIIGAAKAGTTSLHYYLKQHPEVFMPTVKEPDFFFFANTNIRFRDATTTVIQPAPHATDARAYQHLFAKAGNAREVGEASTLYLYGEHVAKAIRDYLPQVKLIVMLRNPADRAYSHHSHLVRDNREPLRDFRQALAAEQGRVRDGWYPSFHYRATGRYSRQLAKYSALFREEQLKVYLYEDLINDPIGLVKDVYRFLGVDDTFTPDTSLAFNASGIPKNRGLHEFVTRRNPLKSLAASLLPETARLKLAVRINSWNLSKTERLPPELREELLHGYRDDLDVLQELLGRDLSNWSAAPSDAAQRPSYVAGLSDR